jgi:hypothetical protein
LGSAVVKREWLVNSPFDEVLDPSGIGDNYGVAVSFPEGIHIVKNTHVYHYRVPENRLKRPLQFYRRGLALDYFMKTKKELRHVGGGWFLWSLTGNFFYYLFSRDLTMMKATLQLFRRAIGVNPYLAGKAAGIKIVKPEL